MPATFLFLSTIKDFIATLTTYWQLLCLARISFNSPLNFSSRREEPSFSSTHVRRSLSLFLSLALSFSLSPSLYLSLAHSLSLSFFLSPSLSDSPFHSLSPSRCFFLSTYLSLFLPLSRSLSLSPSPPLSFPPSVTGAKKTAGRRAPLRAATFGTFFLVHLTQ